MHERQLELAEEAHVAQEGWQATHEGGVLEEFRKPPLEHFKQVFPNFSSQ